MECRTCWTASPRAPLPLAQWPRRARRTRPRGPSASRGPDRSALPKLRLVGRLTKAESVFFLGKDADKITQFSSLTKAKIGVGPEGSGTARIAKQMLDLPELAPLGATL